MRDEGRKTEAVLDLLDAVYEAPFDPRWWQRVGELLAPLFESDCAVLVSHDEVNRSSEFAFAHNLSDADASAYANHYSGIEWPSLPANPKPRGRSFLIEGESQSRTVLDGFFHDFWRHQGDLFYTMGGVAPVDDRVIGSIGLPRVRGRGPYLASALGLLDRISPHIYRALRLSRQLGRADFSDSVLHATPVTQSIAAYLVDDQGRVVFANPRGEHLMRIGDGLAIKQGRLRAQNTADAPAFDVALDSAARGPVANGGEYVDELTLRRAGGRAPLRVSVTPAPVRMLGWLGRGARGAMVIVHVPEPPSGITPKKLQKVLALTQAEARVVAALVTGQKPREIAEASRVSLETVRAQLKSAMRRLDCHRQSELVGKVMEALGRGDATR